MSRWFRHYAGMMRDDKLVRAALRAKQPVERVVWIWGVILESAAEINDGGRYDLDAAEAAYFLRTDETDVLAIFAALEAGGRIAGGAVVKWGDRQFQSDSSSERQKRYRDKQKSAGESDGGRHKQPVHRNGDGDVTPASRHGDAPETETETETERTEANASVLRAPKASRLPDGWRPDNDGWTYAIAELGNEQAARREFENFTDYWKAASGANARKRDWPAAWRTWCRRSSDMRGNRGPPRRAQQSQPSFNEIADEIRRNAANAQQNASDQSGPDTLQGDLIPPMRSVN